ncbi:MAG: methionine adenosyltransferase [Chlorobiaceae bacterium]|jgi:S-adenosylmethionine synthetase|nr:methionine adenosyltransferase [Chlorobiaceae bacterium]
MKHITIEKTLCPSVAELQIELVERKGLGHPDTICDSVMEAASIALSGAYLERCGRILHHNLDKGLLVAGRTSPKPGGGDVLEPMRFVMGDRATMSWNGSPLPVYDIVESAAKTWIKNNLRFVDPNRHVVFQHEIRPGSSELSDSFSRSVIGANDTSAGVGYAPLSETESVVLDTERYLNSPAFKRLFPETGEDIKIMGFRDGRNLDLTIAMAFVDRFIVDGADYFRKKHAVGEHLEAWLRNTNRSFDNIGLLINTLDDPERGEGGMYLTVLGTSAEGADGGEVGRGNRVNGLIAFGRPSSLEAAAGKNPVSHVGKIYNVLARKSAERIYNEVPGVKDVVVFYCSRIGCPIDEPLSASARIVPEHGKRFEPIRREAAAVIESELNGMNGFVEQLARGCFRVC